MTRRAAALVIAFVVAALVGIALLTVPGSPLEKRPTLGLDLQGGLEVTLQAVPPRDGELTQADLDRSVSIMRNRVDKLGVAEPEIRTEGDDRISIQLPGVRGPRRCGGDHRQDRAAGALRPPGEPRLAVDRRAHEAADRHAEALRPPRRPAGPRRARRPGELLRLPHEGQEARPRPGCIRARGAREMGRQAPCRAQAVRRPARDRRRGVRRRGGGVPGCRRGGALEELLVPLPLHAAGRAGDDGRGPEALWDAPGLRHAYGRADRPDGVHRRGCRHLRGDHEERRPAREAPLQHGRRRSG